jgi:small-conductance mechanosensitive channel
VKGRLLLAVLCLLWPISAAAAPAFAQDNQSENDRQATPTAAEDEQPSAPVEIDGFLVCQVRGTKGFPAEKRAEAIAQRIKKLASDSNVPVEAVSSAEVPGGTRILVGSEHVMLLTDADAELESVDRHRLAEIIVMNIREAVTNYRQARSRQALLHSALLSGIATAIMVALLTLIIWSSNRFYAGMERRYRQRIESARIQSFQIFQSVQVWTVVHRTFKTLRVITILIIAFLYVHYVLSLYPWTRAYANRQFGYIIDPLESMGQRIVNEIPNLVFLAILFIVVKYLLAGVHLFFNAVGRGEVSISGFDREWAQPTFTLVRIAILALALVVAYPYIPGSDTAAFKGISVIIGIVFSLGSSSAIGNIIAGYMMTYRRAFRVGDRVKIGDTIGDVSKMRLQVTHLQTIKNEEVTVPNSTILANDVVNFSALARSLGLILHTSVNVGYGTPWRQVEALLLMAAERTTGLMRQPRPFILQKALENLAVTYELNAYCDNAQAMGSLYTDLHRNILDAFNEYGVQIMTPGYEGDPEEPKVVPKDQWFKAPANRIPEEGS